MPNHNIFLKHKIVKIFPVSLKWGHIWLHKSSVITFLFYNMITVAALSFGIDCHYDEIRDLPSLIFFVHENNSHLLLCVIYLKTFVIFNVHWHRTLLLKTYHMRILHIYRMFNVPIGVNTFISWQDRHLFTMNAQQILSFVLKYTICYHLYSPFYTTSSGILLANILQCVLNNLFPSFHQFAFPHLLTQASGHTLYNRNLYFFSFSIYIPHRHEIILFILHMNFLNKNMSQVIIPFQILQVVNSLWCVFCHLLTNRLID